MKYWTSNLKPQGDTLLLRYDFYKYFPITFCLSSLLFFSLCLPDLVHAQDQAQIKYEKALKKARKGQHDAALSDLKQLTQAFPKERRYVYDYIAVLGWAEKDAEVLSFQKKIDLKGAPVYVLETFGRSARKLKDYPLAIRYYKMATKKLPKRLESAMGLAHAYLDNGEAEKTISITRRFHKNHPKALDILELQALAYRSQEKWFETLETYHHILRINPNHRESRRQRIMITAQMGAPHLALSMSKASPDLLSNEEKEAIITDQAAYLIRWNSLYNPHPEKRFADVDVAILLLKDQLKRLENKGTKRSTAYHRTQSDLITAQIARQQFEEAIALYETLILEQVEIPNYVLIAVAEGYMHKKQPIKARDLYYKVLQDDPDNFNIQLSLFYALFDAEEYETAIQHIETLSKKQSNPATKLNVESVAIMAYAWSDQLEEAHNRLEPLVKRAPNNPYLQGSLGFVYLWRGWPRRAKDTFQLTRSIETEVLDGHLGEINAARDLSEFRHAETKINQLKVRYADNTQVLRQSRDWAIHNMRQVIVELSRSKSSGVQEGSRDHGFDVTLYSRPLNFNTRAFIQNHYSTSEFPEGDGLYRRFGVGLEHRIRDFEIVGVLSSGVKRDNPIGLNLRGNWMPDDFWNFGVRMNTYDNDVPLRGRLNEDVKGWSIELSADYRFHESRAVGLSLQRLDFSDGNRRIVSSAAFFQRLVTRPGYKLDSRLGLYSSNNTLENAAYYNPSEDLSIEADLTNEWLVFRRYSRSFIHRLGISLGNYHQSGFGSKGYWGIKYEHQWGFNNRLDLSYGIGRSHPVYDGLSETLVRVYLTLNWRFQA